MKYVAAILDGDDKTAFGVFFPELAGCFSANDEYEKGKQYGLRKTKRNECLS